MDNDCIENIVRLLLCELRFFIGSIMVVGLVIINT